MGVRKKRVHMVVRRNLSKRVSLEVSEGPPLGACGCWGKGVLGRGHSRYRCWGRRDGEVARCEGRTGQGEESCRQRNPTSQYVGPF